MKEEQKKIDDLDGEVAILKNQLSAFAAELANKRVFVASLNRELENKMQRLEEAKKKYKAT
jgi:chromosome segregation ATPase